MAMINFKDIRKKLLKGDFSGLLGLLRLNGSRKKVIIHPAEVAQIFEPLPDELVSPFTAALEHIQASLNLNASLPPVPL